MFVKVCLLVVLATVVMSAPSPPKTSPERELTAEEEWSDFKTKFNRQYKSPEEEKNRFEIFKENLKGVREHNKKYDSGVVTYKQGINDFSDLTHDEFKDRYLMKPEFTRQHSH